MKYSFVIDGQPYSKANSRRIVRFGGHTAVIKSKEALAYERSALKQLSVFKESGKETITNPVGVTMTIYYKSKRPDLDPSLVLDIMEKAGIYKNDRQVYGMHLIKKFDKENPRAEIDVCELETNTV